MHPPKSPPSPQPSPPQSTLYTQDLYNHWWRERQGAKCAEGGDRKSSAVSASHANALGVTNVGGIFLVLVAGLAVAFVVAVIEFVWKARTNWDLTELGKLDRMALHAKVCVVCC